MENEKVKCITFDKEAQDAIPDEVKLKMKADKEAAIMKQLLQKIEVNNGATIQSLTWLSEQKNHGLQDCTEVVRFLLKKVAQLEGYNEAAQSKDEWVSVKDRLPEEGGRYWCYVEEVNDLGVSHFQWNCAYNEDDKSFSAIYLKGGKVTHWMPLPAAPKKAPTPEKNYEILEGVHPNMEVHKWHNVGDKEISCSALGCAIHSVKRLSDGEVFKLGDNVAATPAGKAAPITAIEIVGSTCRLYDNAFYVALGKAIKEPARVPLFKTEDGVDMFEGDQMWYVHTGQWFSAGIAKACKDPFIMGGKLLFFSTKEAAEYYMERNKPRISYCQLEKYIENGSKGSFVEFLKTLT